MEGKIYMDKNLKKGLIIAGIIADVAVTVFLFVVSIIMLATMPKSGIAMDNAIRNNGPFIGYLQQNPNVYLWAFVVPLFVLLILNIAMLALYVKKVSKKAVVLEDLSDEQKEAIRQALLKDMQEQSTDKRE